MKIAVVAASAIPSSRANSIQVMKVSQALLQNGEEPHLYVPGGQSTSWDQLKAQYGMRVEFPISWIPTWKPLRYLDFTARVLMSARLWGAALIYTRMPQVAISAVRFGFPVILELHEIPSGRFGPQFVRQFLQSEQKKMLVFITHALQKLVEDQLGQPVMANQATVAADGVDLERYTDLPGAKNAREQLGLSDQFTALYSGSFYAGRGLELLYQLAQQLPEVQFLWVGGRPDEVEQWQTKINGSDMKNVILTGFVENEKLPLYQAAADLLLMPYSRKIAGSSGGDIVEVTSPMKLFEYLACGRPILSADLPVLREVLNGSNAAFCPPDDLAAWKTTILALKYDPVRREKMALQARQDSTQYSWRLRMQKILNAWQDA